MSKKNQDWSLPRELLPTSIHNSGMGNTVDQGESEHGFSIDFSPSAAKQAETEQRNRALAEEISEKDEKISELQERLTQLERQKESPKSALGRNIDKYRNECGWSLNQLENVTGIDKKLIMGHIKGKGAYPSTIKTYADVFSKELGRRITVSDLKA
jgi:hypothetical protein